MNRHYALNTLRNQIMFGFLLVMTIILAVGGGLTYRSSSQLLADHSEKHMRQTATQAIGRMEALIHQVNTLTLQTATDASVQQLLLNEVSGIQVTFRQRQNLSDIVNNAQIFSTDILAIELYASKYERIYPLDDLRLNERLNRERIEAADRNRGRIVWLGLDPRDSEAVLAIRRIPLMDRWYSNGGYLLVKIHRNYFQFDEGFFPEANRSFILLLDENENVISSNDRDRFQQITLPAEGNRMKLGDADYMVVRQRSAATGWSLVVLTPVSPINEGASVLRSAVIVSGIVGCVLFLIMAWFLSTLITRPIRQLITIMRSSRLGSLRPNPKRYSNMEMNELNHTYNQMVHEMNQLIQLVYEKELMQSRTELKALQAQINPHFLFNTLEALYWSLEARQEDELADMVIAMSQLFRYTITRTQKDEWVTIRDELDHIERYLEITRMRLGDRVDWSIRCDARVDGAAIPKLLLQPLVENAVQHGIENKLGSGFIAVTVESGEHAIVVRIEDDGIGMDAPTRLDVLQRMENGDWSSQKGNGYAIANVWRRLQLFYSDREAGAQMEIESEPNQGTVVFLKIPLEKEGARHAL